MGKKIFHVLIIIVSFLLTISINNCYANQNNSKTPPPPPPPPATSSAQNSSASNTAAQNNQDTNIADKLFDQAGYQYFQINKEIDSEKNYPKLFNIPDSNNDEDDNQG